MSIEHEPDSRDTFAATVGFLQFTVGALAVSVGAEGIINDATPTANEDIGTIDTFGHEMRVTTGDTSDFCLGFVVGLGIYSIIRGIQRMRQSLQDA